MSLGVVIKGPEGIVLAADSRVTLEAEKKGGAIIPINYDNATKLLSFTDPHNYVGCVTYGAAVIGLRTAHSFIPEFEQSVLSGKKERLTIEGYSNELSKFFNERWAENMPKDYKGPNMTFVIGGYDPDAAYGKVFLFEIPERPEPVEQHSKINDFGMTWGGQLEIASRLIHGFDPNLPKIIKETLELDKETVDRVYGKLRENLEFPIPYNILPLQDSVNLAILLIRTTMTAQNLAIGIRGVGGHIDVAVIKRTNGLQYVQQKIIKGEYERRNYDVSSDRK
jgi:hypothetical protein